ncbi:MAG: hypothetical protein AMXMBFR84_12970 [Candidatus Hydrogenedentota bacterium]
MNSMARSLNVGLAIMLCSWVPAGAQEPASANTTLADQVDVAITIYNNNLALVRDRREVALPTGEHALRFGDVANQIKPESVSLRSISAPGSVQILEQNYEYDLMSPQKLMEKYVGKKVRLVNQHKDITATDVEAELLSINEGPVYRVGNDIFLGHPGQVVLPEIPKNLIAKPSLIWQLDNDTANQTIEASYLTNGVSWAADYVLTLAKDETAMDVTGWVTLQNQSGADYGNAQLKLVAGEVNIVPQEIQLDRLERRTRNLAKVELAREESFAEYHLYTIPRRTTIKQNQSKQVSLLTAADVKIGKTYEFRGQESYYSQPMGHLPEQNADVYIHFTNKADNHLGMPLPGGVMRIYQQDSEGMLQFSGEDRIKHTAKDETVRLKMGNAFDVVGERRQLDYRAIASNVHQSEYEVIIRNHKEQDVTVDVVEPMGGDWEILSESSSHDKRDARTAVFTLKVPRDGESKLKYRVQVTY